MFKFKNFGDKLLHKEPMEVVFIYPEGKHPAGPEQTYRYGYLLGFGNVRLMSDKNGGNDWRYQICGVQFDGVIMDDMATLNTDSLMYLLSRVRGSRAFQFTQQAHQQLRAVFEDHMDRNVETSTSCWSTIDAWRKMGVFIEDLIPTDVALGGTVYDMNRKSHEERKFLRSLVDDITITGTGLEKKGREAVYITQGDPGHGISCTIHVEKANLKPLIRELQMMSDYYDNPPKW